MRPCSLKETVCERKCLSCLKYVFYASIFCFAIGTFEITISKPFLSCCLYFELTTKSIIIFRFCESYVFCTVCDFKEFEWKVISNFSYFLQGHVTNEILNRICSFLLPGRKIWSKNHDLSIILFQKSVFLLNFVSK